MIATLLATLAIFGLALGGLALGLAFGRAPLRGSCGGLSCGACKTCPRRNKPGGAA